MQFLLNLLLESRGRFPTSLLAQILALSRKAFDSLRLEEMEQQQEEQDPSAGELGRAGNSPIFPRFSLLPFLLVWGTIIRRKYQFQLRFPSARAGLLGSWVSAALQGQCLISLRREGLSGDSGAGIWGSFNEQGDKSSPSNPFCPLINVALEFPAMHSAREELMIQDVNILFPGSKAEHSFNPCPAKLSSCQGSF